MCNEANLKLTTLLHTNNMVTFDDNGKLRKFDTLDEIIDTFCKVRYRYYTLRKEHIIKEEKNQLELNSSKYRFLQEVMDDTLVIRRKPVSEVARILEEQGYYKKGNDGNVDEGGSYAYLLNLPITSFTKEKLEKLKKEIDEARNVRIPFLEKQTEKQMWLKDLEELEQAYPQFLIDIETSGQKKKPVRRPRKKNE